MRMADGRQLLIAGTRTHFLHRKMSGGADDYQCYQASNGAMYVGSESDISRAEWIYLLLNPPQQPGFEHLREEPEAHACFKPKTDAGCVTRMALNFSTTRVIHPASVLGLEFVLFSFGAILGDLSSILGDIGLLWGLMLLLLIILIEHSFLVLLLLLDLFTPWLGLVNILAS